jgi:hypothetical protein
MTAKSLTRVLLTSALGLSLVIGFGAQSASAQTYKAVAKNFVGTASECAPFPAGSKIVTSIWQGGLGLPDNGGVHPSGSNKHEGLLLSKNGPTPTCSAATAEITINGLPVTHDIDTVGFDFRNGTSCGAGAPRINVYHSGGTAFLGCSGGIQTNSTQAPGEWTRVTHINLGLTGVTGVEIIFDEGTDTALPPDAPAGPGLVVLDNIRINTTFIRRKAGNSFTP